MLLLGDDAHVQDGPPAISNGVVDGHVAALAWGEALAPAAGLEDGVIVKGPEHLLEAGAHAVVTVVAAWDAMAALAGEGMMVGDGVLVWVFAGGAVVAETRALAIALVKDLQAQVDAELEERLHAHWGEGEIVEILGVISLFGYLNRWNDTMGTSIEAGAIESAEKYLTKNGWNKGKHN